MHVVPFLALPCAVTWQMNSRKNKHGSCCVLQLCLLTTPFFKPNLGCHWLHLLLQATAERAGRPRAFGHKLAPREQYQWLPTPSHPLRSLLPVCTTGVGPALSSPSQWGPLTWTQVVSPSGHWWRCRFPALMFFENDKTSKQFLFLIYIYIHIFFSCTFIHF